MSVDVGATILAALTVVASSGVLALVFWVWQMKRRLDSMDSGSVDVGSERDTSGSEGGVKWRKNVLTLLGVAYVSLLVIFGVMVFSGIEPDAAYQLGGVPFVALVGGTLTIAKDLL